MLMAEQAIDDEVLTEYNRWSRERQEAYRELQLLCSNELFEWLRTQYLSLSRSLFPPLLLLSPSGRQRGRRRPPPSPMPSTLGRAVISLRIHQVRDRRSADVHSFFERVRAVE
jgi:hypothetical protein